MPPAVRLARSIADQKIYFAGHWGLQYYMERVGASALDASAQGWEIARPGDVVVVPEVNADIVRPLRPRPARVIKIEVGHSLPLRLMSVRREAGFYSSLWVFLPWTVSRDPVDVLRVLKLEGD